MPDSSIVSRRLAYVKADLEFPVAQARTFLEQFLAHGSDVPVPTIQRAATAHGLPWWAIRAAKRTLLEPLPALLRGVYGGRWMARAQPSRVRVQRHGFGAKGYWTWRLDPLPEDNGDESDDESDDSPWPRDEWGQPYPECIRRGCLEPMAGPGFRLCEQHIRRCVTCGALLPSPRAYYCAAHAQAARRRTKAESERQFRERARQVRKRVRRQVERTLRTDTRPRSGGVLATGS